MITILIAEDDESLNALLSIYLKNNGYAVTSCKNGKDAFDSFKSYRPDIIVSDIMMPVMDGFKLAQAVREIDKNIPILFITAKDDKLSKQLGYTLGIDDYIVKPFDIDELVMKIRAILRRSMINVTKRLEIGNLVMDEAEHSAYIDGNPVNLTVREFDILFKLLSNPKVAFTRGKLMEEFWDFDSSATSRTVDVYMAKIREKTSTCDGFEIQTVHGLGYKAVLK